MVTECDSGWFVRLPPPFFRPAWSPRNTGAGSESRPAAGTVCGAQRPLWRLCAAFHAGGGDKKHLTNQTVASVALPRCHV